MVIFTLVALFLAGPRPKMEQKIQMPALPADLDGYLRASEAQVGGVKPGAEKTIIWADPVNKSRTPVSIVYLHGFSATRQETRPLCDTLAARLGANLFYTRLSGHGRDGDAMSDATVNDWLNDGVEALEIGRRIGKKVIVVGTSTGGTLATWLAGWHGAKDLLALVMLSPNFGPRDPNARVLSWPWGGLIARAIVGPYYSWEPVNAQQARYWNTRYPTHALVTMMGLVELVKTVRLEAIKTPLMVIYSENDRVISADELKLHYERFGSPVKHILSVDQTGHPSNHVLAGDILSPETTLPLADSIMAFLHPLVKAD